MTITVQRPRRSAQFHQFHELQIEYENSLPADLRHDLPGAPTLEIIYSEPNAAFLGVIDQGAVGCVAITRLDMSTSVIKRLYVKPGFRQLGIARVLVHAAIEYSREQRQDRVVLDTDRTRLEAAYNLYVALGFVDTEPYGPVDYAGPTYMELRLR